MTHRELDRDKTLENNTLYLTVVLIFATQIARQKLNLFIHKQYPTVEAVKYLSKKSLLFTFFTIKTG